MPRSIRSFYGGATGANWWTWAIAYVVGDGKMRGLFTMMFGASTVLIAERAFDSEQSPTLVHYARMATLFVFGMVHAYLIWCGRYPGALFALPARWRSSRGAWRPTRAADDRHGVAGVQARQRDDRLLRRGIS